MPFQKPGFRDLYAALETDLRRRAPALTDWEEGSVVRSLFESFAVEMALLYEQMERVYDAGFVDTATDANLDRVVAVLGITRNEPDFATGTVTFERDPGSTATVTVPAGTLVTTEEREGARKAYLTIEDAVLLPGQTAADAKVQAEERGAVLTTESETVVVMPRPVPGIKAVRNPPPIRFLGRERETDEQLRERAKKALLASGRASATAIENALLGMPGVRGVRVVERFPTVRAQDDAGAPLAGPGAPEPEAGAASGDAPQRGAVKVYVDGLTADNAARLRQRVDEVRAAGVFVLMEPAVPIRVEAVLKVEADPNVRGDELKRLEGRVADAAVGALDRLRMGEPLLFSQLTREVLGVEGVTDLDEFRLYTYREGTAAEGTVRLSRPAAAGALSVRAGTELRTAAGQRFTTAELLVLDSGQAAGTVLVRALRLGRDGELLRTGDGVAWQTLEVDGTELAVRNDEPLRLPRTTWTPDARRIPARVEQRFMAERVRVAAGDETLAVHVRVDVALPAPAGAQAAAGSLADAVVAAGKAVRSSPAWLENVKEVDDAGKVAVNRAVDRWLAAVRAAAANLPPVAGLLDEATRTALAAAVPAHFQAALAAAPPGIKESELRAALAGVLAQHLAPAALRQVLDAPLSAWLAALRASLPPFPADAVADALRAGLQRAADAAAAGKPASADAARQLAEALARVPERAAALEAAVRGAVQSVDAPARDAAADAAGAAGAFTVGVRLRTVGHDGEVRPDQPYVEPSFVETPEAASVFVYTRTLELAGTLPLSLPLTATQAERERIRAEVAQGVADYLDALGPEEGVALDAVRAVAAAHPRVVSVGDFRPADALRPRLDRGGRVLTVLPQEKAVPSPGGLVLGG